MILMALTGLPGVCLPGRKAITGLDNSIPNPAWIPVCTGMKDGTTWGMRTDALDPSSLDSVFQRNGNQGQIELHPGLFVSVFTIEDIENEYQVVVRIDGIKNPVAAYPDSVYQTQLALQAFNVCPKIRVASQARIDVLFYTNVKY